VTVRVVLVVTLVPLVQVVAVHEPIDPVVRLAISQWPDDAPRGAVSTFCAEHGTTGLCLVCEAVTYAPGVGAGCRLLDAAAFRRWPPGTPWRALANSA
jgi:hypothetical protein